MNATITLNDGRKGMTGRRDAGLVLRLITDFAQGRDHAEYDFGGGLFTVGDVTEVTVKR